MRRSAVNLGLHHKWQDPLRSQEQLSPPRQHAQAVLENLSLSCGSSHQASPPTGMTE